jgi:hypothetical protein
MKNLENDYAQKIDEMKRNYENRLASLQRTCHEAISCASKMESEHVNALFEVDTFRSEKEEEKVRADRLQEKLNSETARADALQEQLVHFLNEVKSAAIEQQRQASEALTRLAQQPAKNL